MLIGNCPAVVWLIPGKNGFSYANKQRYMGPLFEEFNKICPNLHFITTDRIHPEYKQIFKMSSCGSSQYVRIRYPKERYLAILSPLIVFRLFSLKPRVVISTSFNLWTILSTVFKDLGRWKIVILHDGFSSTVDFRGSRLTSRLRKYVARRTDVFLTNSITGKEYLHKWLHVPESKISKQIYQLGDKSVMMRHEWKFLIPNVRKPVFLFVGRLLSWKGCYQLLKAWVLLEKKSSNQASLIIAGNGELREELTEMIVANNIKNVHFIGAVEYESIGYLYKTCDIFIFPSWGDIWGVVVIEAMMFEMPVLCSKYTGSSELIREGENGYLFDPFDSDKLAELMLMFINNKTLIDSFGRRSGEIMESYSPEKAAAGFFKVIENLPK